MSTKIYTGVKFNVSSLPELQELLSDYRRKVAVAVEEELCNFLIRSAVMDHDRNSFSPTPDTGSSFSRSWRDFVDRTDKIKNTGRRDPAVDFFVEVSFFHFEGLFYGILHAEQATAMKLLRSDPRAEDFSYWNNTDPPDTLTEDAWNERGRVWDGIFLESSTPSEAGFSRTIHSGSLFPDPATIGRFWVAARPSLEQRIEHWCKEIYLDRCLGNEPATANISDVMSKMRAAQQDVSAKALHLRQTVRGEVASKLKHDLSLEELGLVMPTPETQAPETQAPETQTPDAQAPETQIRARTPAP